MKYEDEVSYHNARAMRELDLGLVSRSIDAARAHLQLSSLHLQEARSLQQGSTVSKPPLIMA